MKKHLSTIVTVLALAIAVISQFRISNLQGEIRQMENRLNIVTCTGIIVSKLDDKTNKDVSDEKND